MIFEQEGNCCDGGDEVLIVHVKDGGGGKFLILETDQWATTIEEITEILKKVNTAFECEGK